MNRTDLERLIAAELPDELSELDIDALRASRDECRHGESELSYLRRLVQGRLDIVAAEARRRAEGASPGQLADLVARLPEILTDHGVGGPSRSPSAAPLDEPDPDPELAAELDAIVGPRRLGTLPELSDDELTDTVERLQVLEGRVSHDRRTLHRRLDELQQEIGRRYRDGEASVESVLP